MAKPEKDTPADESMQVIEPVPAKTITFRDKQYTSRSLILPDRRVLPVAQARVTVEGDDDVAIAFLRKRSDFEQVRE
ncbi:hypothetical protein NJF44_15680 [Pseudomonas guariconensis]|uniref:hypothetical protein n=1 Tax=Pseudomonas TaxID=286 RepID=UPI002096D506|nr:MULTISPECIES: hypothetical protein [Pseudomonas]MCO7516421.1 hypothetical protein [Pseudomonas putida]MCO7606679.1 hypothetical protein [Pseudomonas guariconensis]